MSYAELAWLLATIITAILVVLSRQRFIKIVIVTTYLYSGALYLFSLLGVSNRCFESDYSLLTYCLDDFRYGLLAVIYITYVLMLFIGYSNNQNTIRIEINNIRFTPVLILVFFSVLYVYLDDFGLSRSELKEGSSKIHFIATLFTFMVAAYLYPRARIFLKICLISYCLLISVISMEREYITMIMLVIVLSFRKYKAKHALLMSAIAVIVLYWKQLYLFILFGYTPENVLFKLPAEFALGPGLFVNSSELGLLGIENFDTSIFSQVFKQFSNVFLGTDYDTMARRASEEATNNEMGTAYSHLLELFSNGGFLFVAIFAYTLGYLLRLPFLDNILVDRTLKVFLVVKLMRMEILVWIKLYVFWIVLIILLLFVISRFSLSATRLERR
jgi:hypothetical protein